MVLKKYNTYDDQVNLMNYIVNSDYVLSEENIAEIFWQDSSSNIIKAWGNSSLISSIAIKSSVIIVYTNYNKSNKL